MRLALTVALILSVVGEMLASQDGLGLAIGRELAERFCFILSRST